VLNIPITETSAVKINLSTTNNELKDIDIGNINTLAYYINSKITDNNKIYGIGGYTEDRIIYRRSKHFGEGTLVRSIHLGIDIWHHANSEIKAPIKGKIHSFKNNNNYGDYGPTIILEHKLDNHKFYTLYGHLTTDSLKQKQIGQTIDAGEFFASIGNQNENGNWPPHLHFQIITNMQNYWGDYPGVCSKEQRTHYTNLCPDPNLILNLPFI
jgi:murein DD-endopeptidase MepM/ murein hydrolase activator NlpD